MKTSFLSIESKHLKTTLRYCTFAINQAEENTKLDNLLLSVGELKESISEIKRRPSAFWDKLLFALIGAVGTALGYALIGFVN